MLHKLTIIMITYNRQPYALRAMNYWSNYDVTLHVLDGSPKGISFNYLKEIDINVKYHHMPISISKRLRKIIGQINTEYTMLSGDDDIFIPSSIEKCIYEIEVNKELVSCMGRSLAFTSEKKKVMGWPIYDAMKGYSIFQEGSVDRMVYHADTYTCSTIYSVVKTSVWRKAMTAVVQNDFQVNGLEELQFELGVSYLGKSKVVDELMWLRSQENPPIRNYKQPLNRAYVWWEDKKNRKEHDEFLKIMGDVLSNEGPDNIGKITKGLRSAMDAYTAHCNDKNTKIKSLHNKIRLLILTLLPGKAKDLLKVLLRKEGHPSLLEAAKNIERTGVNVNFEELKHIVDIINDFHAKDKFVYENKGM